ncbi:MAG: hypothetical protein N3A66_05720, partial [Planctomycetota bacterium]|nr:hypothetical protein [Planctomycetota bacterium]
AIDLPPQSWRNITLRPPIPERFGGYALVVQFEGQDRLFAATCVRTFRPELKKRRFYKLTMDLGEPDALLRLGCTVNRMGFPFKPPSDPKFEEFYRQQTAYLERLKQADLPVTVEFGGGDFYGPTQPLGRPRPWLDEEGVMLETKFDLAWLPSYDDEFRKLVKRLLVDYGWPKGPINAIKLWNEPWNGISISGWGADDERFREITRAMLQGLEEAKREAGVQVWHGGADSSSNTFDKYFGDGSTEFLKHLDFMSIHYQGTCPMTTVKMFLERKDAEGKSAPVEVWDTESWVANSDDRVAGVLASMYSFGQKRVVGIQSDNIVTAIQDVEIFTENGKERCRVLQTWSVGAAVGAFQHFVGERDFRELLFKNGLPFVMVFDGEKDERGGINPEDGTVVVLGDMGAIYGFDNVDFRTVRSLAEVAKKELMRRQLADLAVNSPERAALAKQIAAPEPIRNASMTIEAQGDAFRLYDFYGNPVLPQDGKIVIPLDARGFYLRGNGQPGSFAALIAALQKAHISGYEPLAKKARDMIAPIGKGAAVRLELTNILNRPISGALAVTLGNLQIEYPKHIAFAPHETRDIEVKVIGGEPRPENEYPLRLVFDAGADGLAVHEEIMRVNLIAKRTIQVDGKLDDWQGALPQSIRVEGSQEVTLTEKAWLPFMPFDESFKQGFAVGFLAYDDENFYFAAKVTDTTPHPGTLRFAARDD